MITPHCLIASGNHDFKQIEVSMRFAKSISKEPIIFIIIDNVWIGAHSVITDGVKIVNDSVVAAGSVVTTEVLPWSILAGVPAKGIRSRN